jgi:hypothetical protein
MRAVRSLSLARAAGYGNVFEILVALSQQQN